jgi:glutathione synthase
MRFGFIVNDIATEQPQYTTTRLAFAATRRGHEVWTIGIGDLAQDPGGAVMGLGYSAADKRYRSLTSFAKDQLGAGSGRREKVVIDDLDLLMLRNDPSDDALDRPWAQTAGVLFGQLAAANGVIVVNDPVHLADAINKTYFQHFPEEVRPETLISRDAEDLKRFVADRGGCAVLKPLQGSGGQGVFVVRGTGPQNVSQIIESITRDGFVVAQEYLTEAEAGDVRLFVMNGQPLKVGDTYAAFRRVNATDDPRSNMHAGGQAKPVKVTPAMLRLVEVVRPKLIQNGMFLVGLDIVGTKLMEVNVFSPGGLGSISALYDVDFADAVVEAMERKVALRAGYGPSLPNTALATL